MTEKEGADHKILDVAVVVGAVPAVLYLFGTVALSATAHGYVIPSSLIHAEPWDIIAEGARAFLDLIPRSLKVGQWTAAVVAILGYAGLADSMRAQSMLRFAVALPLALIALCGAIALACDKEASKSLKEIVVCSKGRGVRNDEVAYYCCCQSKRWFDTNNRWCSVGYFE